ncbi:site-specific integrase, partial [Xenorhabdus bovienii]|uniref:site-specific integrase n=1 Tax=Xenorhabdus bovienii TaxID=40576 RepID=UPI003BB1CFA0
MSENHTLEQHPLANPLIEQFLDTIWLKKDLAENTLASYRLDLQALNNWLVNYGHDVFSVQSI